jgi:hypothetical protein
MHPANNPETTMESEFERRNPMENPLNITTTEKTDTAIKFLTPSPPQTLKRKKYTLAFRMRVAKLAERVESNVAVARFYSIDESNVRYWRKKFFPVPGKAHDTFEDDEDESDLHAFNNFVQQRKLLRPRFPKMEAKLFEWFKGERACSHPVSRRMIRNRALEIIKNTKENENDIFKASTGWFYGFCKRYKLSRRKVTHAIQNLPEDFKNRISKFFYEVAEARKTYLEANKRAHIVFGKQNLFFCL